MVKGLGKGSYPQNLWITEQDERSASRAMILGLASVSDTFQRSRDSRPAVRASIPQVPQLAREVAIQVSERPRVALFGEGLGLDSINALLLDTLNPALARTIIPFGEPNALLSEAERGWRFLLEGGVSAENGP